MQNIILGWAGVIIGVVAVFASVGELIRDINILKNKRKRLENLENKVVIDWLKDSLYKSSIKLAVRTVGRAVYCFLWIYLGLVSAGII